MPRSEAGPRALLLVRNDVRYDARVLRAAKTLQGAGARTLVLGVLSDRMREPRSTYDDVIVQRLDPHPPLARLVRRLRDGSPTAAAAPAPAAAAGAPADLAAPSRPGLLQRLGRLASTVDYYRRGVGVVLRIRPALVHANDYNTMWIAVAAKLLTGSRVVYDAHELWPDRNGRWESRGWLVACEALFVRVADAVITASPGYAVQMAQRYRVPLPSVVRNIPAAAGLGMAPRPGPPPDAPPLVVYVGGLLRGRGLEQTIAALVHAPRVHLRLVGPGSPGYVAALRDQAAAAGVGERVEFRDAVAPGDVGAAMSGACLGLSLIQPVCLSYELTLPNKIFEYMAAGLPVLVSDLPVMAAFVAEHGIGEAVCAGDPVRIAAALDRLTRPAAQAPLRERVAAAARTLTWAREQEKLLGAYGLPAL